MPDLITQEFLTNALAAGGITVNAAQTTVLANVVTGASGICQRFCNDRDFVRATYTEEYRPALDGLVALNQVPVNQVLKVEGERDSALSITCDPTQATSAWVAFTQTGDWATGITVTGITLSRISNGVQVDTPLLFATYPTIGALVTAINAAGGGWSAPGASGYANWPTSALVGGDTAQGAMADNGARLSVYGRVLAGCSVEHDTGILSTGQLSLSGVNGPQWGPDWLLFEDPPAVSLPKVRVTYDAGFTTVPLAVQQACAEVAIDLLNILKSDQRLASETDGAYSYTLALRDAIAAYDVPMSAAGKLSRYILHRA